MREVIMIIKVKCCEECPYHLKNALKCNYLWKNFTFKEDGSDLYKYKEGFPEWCPFEEVKEGDEEC